ncbi:unnamed protein product [Mytilus coruscus]|uniref:MEGF10_11 n=1 Tax=Mytilus coruscus TaxID=42192 RepID=A0A6J8BY15_MYTCO|nr:unnamed protein product [Mytilus coruscus]
MSVIFIIIILCFIDEGNSLKGLNVCYDKERNIEYCCSDYEDVNGTCTECKIGFVSISGKPCSHCQKNRFGKRCLERCICNEIEERCDHVKGCVPKFVLSRDVNYTTRSEVENYSESMTVFELDVLIIWTAIAVIIVMIGGCLGFTYLCKKRNKINVASSSYLQVINGSYGTVIDNNENEDRCRHLNPYVSLVPKTSDTHYYMYYE